MSLLGSLRGPLLAAVVVAATGSGCAGEEPGKARPTGQAASQCRAQWHQVGESVLGLDEETEPSTLATRWNTIVATIQYHEATATGKDCRATIDAQVEAISALRELNDQLRRYDMSYQAQQVAAAVDLYLHDPLPAPARNENGTMVRPPAKPAVRAAMETLTSFASAADAELRPGWGQLASVDLDDPTAVRAAIADLDQLAQDSVPWQRCEAALQVIVAAVRAQEGLGTATPTG